MMSISMVRKAWPCLGSVVERHQLALRGGLRLCVDYRRLNAVTHRDVFLIPRIGDLLYQLSGKVFSNLDAKSG